MHPNQNNSVYDCVIIGGGPAGLSAAIYLGRFLRKVMVVDRADGRWESHEVNQNYFGFPDGIPTLELRQRGIDQALKYGAEMQIDSIQSIEKKSDIFTLVGKESSYSAKTILIATGVKDRFPQFDNMEECLGKSLFWCITCDGYNTQNKKVMVVGYTKEAMTTALQFLNYTDQIMIVTNMEVGTVAVDQRLSQKLASHGIEIHEGRISEVTTQSGMFEKIILSTGKELLTDMMFSLQGASPNSQLAQSLGVTVNQYGYIESDIEQRTNIAGVYAAGDVTKAFAHQIVTAAHEGAQAAQAINYDLYLPEQREE
jgi:thioredoxin reductase (NADPH)